MCYLFFLVERRSRVAFAYDASKFGFIIVNFSYVEIIFIVVGISLAIEKNAYLLELLPFSNKNKKTTENS